MSDTSPLTPLLTIDERKGRRLAVEEGVPVIGLLGVVLLAKRRQCIPSATCTVLSASILVKV